MNWAPRDLCRGDGLKGAGGRGEVGASRVQWSPRESCKPGKGVVSVHLGLLPGSWHVGSGSQDVPRCCWTDGNSWQLGFLRQALWVLGSLSDEPRAVRTPAPACSHLDRLGVEASWAEVWMDLAGSGKGRTCHGSPRPDGTYSLAGVANIN